MTTQPTCGARHDLHPGTVRTEPPRVRVEIDPNVRTRGTLPDATARFGLGALDEAGLLDDYRSPTHRGPRSR